MISAKYSFLRQLTFTGHSISSSTALPGNWRVPASVTHGLSGFNKEGVFYPYFKCTVDSMSRSLKVHYRKHWVEIGRTDTQIDCRFTKYGAQYKVFINPLTYPFIYNSLLTVSRLN